MAVSKYTIIQNNLGNIGEWIQNGLFEYQIFQRLGISKPTWEKYKKESSDLRAVLEVNRDKRNAKLIPQLENTLIKVALGYTEEEAQIETSSEMNDDGEILTKRKVTKKVYPPDVGAIQILLKNFHRSPGTPWTDNPVGDELKRRQLALVEEQAKLKERGF